LYGKSEGYKMVSVRDYIPRRENRPQLFLPQDILSKANLLDVKVYAETKTDKSAMQGTDKNVRWLGKTT